MKKLDGYFEKCIEDAEKAEKKRQKKNKAV